MVSFAHFWYRHLTELTFHMFWQATWCKQRMELNDHIEQLACNCTSLEKVWDTIWRYVISTIVCMKTDHKLGISQCSHLAQNTRFVVATQNLWRFVIPDDSRPSQSLQRNWKPNAISSSLTPWTSWDPVVVHPSHNTELDLHCGQWASLG